MKISRRGASADFGESSIEFKSPTFAWNDSASCLTAKQSRVKDFSTGSRHNYTVSLSVAEINGLLQALSDAAVSDPSAFGKALEPSLRSLLRLQAVAAGVVG